MIRLRSIAAGCAAVLWLAGTSGADVNVKGDVHISFGDDEQRLIRDYYEREIIEKAQEKAEKEGKGKKGKGKKQKGLQPGLAKKSKLPPGIQKQLERGAILPADLEKEIQPLPRELEVRLKPLASPNQVRVTVGSDGSALSGVHDVKALVLSFHPVVVIETVEEERVLALLREVADQV